MNRRSFIGGATAFAAALPGVRTPAAVSNARTTDTCDCDPFFIQAGGEQAARADAFHDIVTGSNGAFSAGPGWDACTGLGSPSGENLLKALG